MENYTPTMEVRYANMSARLSDEEIVEALEIGLTQHFMEVEVKWVNCPDLTREPFNLAAPGLCGKTAILDFGNMSYLDPYPRMDKTYDINQFLRHIGRSSYNSFIFGAGFSQRPSNGTLGELAINSAFWPALQMNNRCNNKSRILFINSEQCKCDFETLTVSQLKCNIQGTFFLSEGTRSERVLQVYAKKYRNTNFGGFTNSMHCVLCQATAFTERVVVLGGVYITYNQKWVHKVWPYEWEYAPFCRRMYREICTVEEPSAIISIFSNDSPIISSLYESALNLSFGRLTQNLYHYSGNGFHDVYELSSTNGAAYLGYFCVADEVYRIDE